MYGTRGRQWRAIAHVAQELPILLHVLDVHLELRSSGTRHEPRVDEPHLAPNVCKDRLLFSDRGFVTRTL